VANERQAAAANGEARVGRGGTEMWGLTGEKKDYLDQGASVHPIDAPCLTSAALAAAALRLTQGRWVSAAGPSLFSLFSLVAATLGASSVGSLWPGR